MLSCKLMVGMFWAKFHKEIRRTCDSTCRSYLFRKWLKLMVLKTTFVNKIKELGYSLNDETKRVHIYRKKGSDPPHYLTVHKCDKLEDEFVRSSLNQAGVPRADIDKFIADYKA